MRLIQNKFEAWLKAKPPTEVVGHNRDCHSCPLALFYLETSSGCEVVIFENGERYMIDRGYSTNRLPWWANRFAHAVDGDADGTITASRALAVLDRIQ